MDPVTLIAFGKNVFSFVDNVRAVRKLKKERERLEALVLEARVQIAAARASGHQIASELMLFTEAAKASDEISKAMVEISTQLSLNPAAIDWVSLGFEIDRLRHSGPLSRLVTFKNHSGFSPTALKNDLSSAIQQIDVELSRLELDEAHPEELASKAGAIVQACDMLYRTRNRAVSEFAIQLGDALAN